MDVPGYPEAGKRLKAVLDKESGKYLVKIEGDAKAFAGMNDAAAGFAKIIGRSEVAKVAFAASHERLALTDTEGRHLTLSSQRGAGIAGRANDDQLWVYVLRPEECCTDVEASKFGGIWFAGIRDALAIGVNADAGTEAGHEWGHADYLMDIQQTGASFDLRKFNKSALDLENAVRKARDRNAPVRTVH